MRRLLVAASILLWGANLGQAVELQAGLPLAANVVIEVRSFDRNTETFCVFAVKLPGEGDSFVTVRALADAAENLGGADMLGNPDALVGKQFKMAKDLATVEGDALEAAHPGCTLG
jgi:hypothetical protein